MSPTPSLLSIITGARRSVRRDAVIAITAGIAAIIPAALLIAWVVGAPTGASKLPLFIDVVALALALALAAAIDAPLLGQVPLDLPLRTAGDVGVPAVVAVPEAASSVELGPEGVKINGTNLVVLP